MKTYVVTPHLNRLDETVQMWDHNICFMQNQEKLSLIITKYSLLSRDPISGQFASFRDFLVLGSSKLRRAELFCLKLYPFTLRVYPFPALRCVEKRGKVAELPPLKMH